MIVTVTVRVQKRCPFVPEIDYGTAVLTFDIPEGEMAPELHGLAKQLDAARGEEISHEEYTQGLLNTWGHAGLIRAETTWQTAGMEVRCST